MTRPNLKYDTTGDLQAAKLSQRQEQLDKAYRWDNYVFRALVFMVLFLLALAWGWVGR